MPRALRVSVPALVIAAAALLLPASVSSRTPSKDLGQERIAAAKATFEAVKAALAAGSGTPESAYLWSVRWLAAQQEAGQPRAKALADHLSRVSQLETAVKARFQSGAATRADVLAAAYYRVEAEFWSAAKK